MPVAPTARAPQPTPIDRRESRAIPGGKVFPWRRPASTATHSGRFPIASFALSEIAGPLPVSLPNLAFINADITTPFLTTLPHRNSPECDLVHRALGRLVLNLRNGPEKLPTIVGSETRHSHRLRLDCHRRRRGLVRADLSHPDLIKRQPRLRTLVFLGMSAATRRQSSARARISLHFSLSMEQRSPRSGKTRQVE